MNLEVFHTFCQSHRKWELLFFFFWQTLCHLTGRASSEFGLLLFYIRGWWKTRRRALPHLAYHRRHSYITGRPMGKVSAHKKPVNILRHSYQYSKSSSPIQDVWKQKICWHCQWPPWMGKRQVFVTSPPGPRPHRANRDRGYNEKYGFR